jgi:hypothetical protein
MCMKRGRPAGTKGHKLTIMSQWSMCSCGWKDITPTSKKAARDAYQEHLLSINPNLMQVAPPVMVEATMGANI